MDAKWSREALAEELLLLARCPIEWNVVGRFTDPADFFEWDWLHVYQEHAVDREYRWIDDPYSNLTVDVATEPLDEIRADLCNLRERAPGAAREFLQRSRRFWALRAADPREHPKHYPPGGLLWPSVIERTSNGVSLLRPGVGPGQLAETFWSALTELCSPFDEKRRLRLRETLFSDARTRIAVDLPSVIGAAYGKETHCLCFELDANTPLLHAYPVSPAEASELGAFDLHGALGDLGRLDDVSMREMTQRPYGQVRGGSDVGV